jgi:UDP-glucose 4-epimerase
VSPYGVTKLAAEHLCYLYYVNYGVPTVSLRYFTVYGPRQRPDMAFHKFLRAALTGQPIAIYGDGEQTRDFTFVSDVVNAFLTVADSTKTGAYNVGSGKPVSVNELVRLLGSPATVHIPKRPGEPDCTWADIGSIGREFGWEPKVAFADGVKVMRENIEYWRDAPVWTATGIAEATSDWFQFLGSDQERTGGSTWNRAR